MKRDVYAEVNEKIIGLMEKGVNPWEMTWVACSNTYNIISGNEYSLLNRMILPKSGAYASFKQWKELGGKIRYGEKASHVYFYKMMVTVEKEDGETENVKPELDKNGKPKTYPILKCFPVFHVSQIDWPDGMPDKVKKILEEQDTGFELSQNDKDAVAEAIIKAYTTKYGIKILNDNDPCYRPLSDTVHCWDIDRFKTMEGYYGALFHELGHSTGHPTRLNRDFSGRFGSKSYAREELVAEISSGYINAMLGLETEDSMKNHAAYVQNWKNVISNDKRAFVVAAGKAEKAIDCLLCGKEIEDFVNENKKTKFSILESLNLNPPKAIAYTSYKLIEHKPVVDEQALLFGDEEAALNKDLESFLSLNHIQKISHIAKMNGALTGVIETRPRKGEYRGTSSVILRLDNGKNLHLGSFNTPKAKTKKVQCELMNEFMKGVYKNA